MSLTVTIPENMTSASFRISNTDTTAGRFAFIDAAIAAGDVFTPPDQLGRGWYVVLPSGTCKPDTCAAHGYNCCPTGQTCNSIVCVSSCTPATCRSLGFNCGTASDGCGGTLRCGNCSHHQTCNNNVCGGHP